MLKQLAALGFMQVAAMTCASLVILVGGIVGADIAPTKSLATMPVAAMVVGTAIFSIPAALLMKRIGRRLGFTLAMLVAGLSALLAAFAIAERSFFLFCFATICIGANLAFSAQYRFAAAEAVDEKRAGSAVSFLLFCGIGGGILGPSLLLIDITSMPSTVEAFGVVCLLCMVTAFFFLFLYRNQESLTIDDFSLVERPLRAILKNVKTLVAIFSSASAYGVMSFVMTAAPLNMHHMHNYSMKDTGFVIQSHWLAMFLPCLITGFLIGRFGVLRFMLTGVILLEASLLIMMLELSFLNYWVTLVLLGVGWNFLFIGATVLLMETFRPIERFKVQAVNDFATFSLQSIAALSSGALVLMLGWAGLNIVVQPLIAMTFFGLLYLMK